MTLIDTNVLLDIFTKEPTWFTWSLDQLLKCQATGPLIVNEVVYAELAASFATQASLDAALAGLDIALERTPIESLFWAGKAFKKYRSTGGVRTGVLPDFFIGAHAQVARLPILTRDTRRYRTYFPQVALITPA